MKQIIALAIGLTLVGAAQADYYREYRHQPRTVIVERVQTGGDVLVPLIIGGIFGAAIANANQPQPVVIQQQPQVYVQPQAPQGFVQCPPGTMPFEQRGWVRNPWGQWIQSSYIDCR
ncbi:MAG: hypothetical protein EBY81_07015 [Verrucomicrobia bacterium]|nr:hypothetical protein [Verrucomicrobiota bacterium]